MKIKIGNTIYNTNNSKDAAFVLGFLKRRGADLGTYGKNKDGVDGHWGAMSQKAWTAYLNNQKSALQASLNLNKQTSDNKSLWQLMLSGVTSLGGSYSDNLIRVDRVTDKNGATQTSTKLQPTDLNLNSLLDQMPKGLKETMQGIGSSAEFLRSAFNLSSLGNRLYSSVKDYFRKLKNGENTLKIYWYGDPNEEINVKGTDKSAQFGHYGAIVIDKGGNAYSLDYGRFNKNVVGNKRNTKEGNWTRTQLPKRDWNQSDEEYFKSILKKLTLGRDIQYKAYNATDENIQNMLNYFNEQANNKNRQEYRQWTGNMCLGNSWNLMDAAFGKSANNPLPAAGFLGDFGQKAVNFITGTTQIKGKN